MKFNVPRTTEPQTSAPPLLRLLLPPLVASMALMSCARGTQPAPQPTAVEPALATLQPVLVTEPVAVDSDDPAIWVNPEDPSQSLVIGTDKGGSLYVFDLEGRIIPEKTFATGGRFNNVDVEYGFELGGEAIDIAVATDRPVRLLRVFRLPEMTPIDNGGIPVFAGETGDAALPMGIALYKRPSDGAVFAIVSRKTGPSGAYLWQYRLENDGSGQVTGTRVREFGTFSDATILDEGVPELGEIESVAVDDALGYVYYSDELAGVKKYHADPDVPDAGVELAIFGNDGFAEQREGISIYTIDDGTGYILVSDQQGNASGSSGARVSPAPPTTTDWSRPSASPPTRATAPRSPARRSARASRRGCSWPCPTTGPSTTTPGRTSPATTSRRRRTACRRLPERRPPAESPAGRRGHPAPCSCVRMDPWIRMRGSTSCSSISAACSSTSPASRSWARCYPVAPIGRSCAAAGSGRPRSSATSAAPSPGRSLPRA